jgi:membrane protein implicated in regulation of membrane protease activity
MNSNDGASIDFGPFGPGGQLLIAAFLTAPAIREAADPGNRPCRGRGVCLGAGERYKRWLGKHGTTFSPLRPAGIAEIDGERVDVVSEGEFIDVGMPIVVTRVDGNRIVVRRHRASTEGS